MNWPLVNCAYLSWGGIQIETCFTTIVVSGVDLVVIKDDDVGPTTPMALETAKRSVVDQWLGTARLPAALAPAQHRRFVYAGDLVTYTVVVVNAGVYTATNVVVSETLPLYTDYVGIGWTYAPALGGRTYTRTVGTLAPGDGRVYYFVVRVHDPLPVGVTNLINLVCVWSDEIDLDPDDNCNYEDTPVRTSVKLYVANYDSGTVDVFDTNTFAYLRTIPVGVNPFGMALYGDLLFVADFDAAVPSQANLHVVNTLNDTVVASVPVGAHAIHVVAYDGYVYVASHSSPPAITVIRAEAPWDIVAQFTLDRHLTYEFGFFGATVDTTRHRVYFSKRDFGGIGMWSLTPPASGNPWPQPVFVFETDESRREKPGTILYHRTTDRVYAAFGLIDELWAFDPATWALVERIPTGHQDPTDPGFGAHGLAALGQCVFVSNYLDQSVTAVVDGSCLEWLGPSLPISSPGPYGAYLPRLNIRYSVARSIEAVFLPGRPKGMAAGGNLLFVTLPIDGNEQPLNQVAVINTETRQIIHLISVPGEHPHTAVLGGGNHIDMTSGN
jgi:uncharacterized repeat protein (TIGR01451 family)